MQVSLAGFAVCAGLLLVGYCLRATLIVALMGSFAFGSTAIGTLAALGGSSPLVFTLIAFILLLFVLMHRATLSELALVFTEYRAAWIALGPSMQAVHAATLPAGLVERVPQEDYSPVWRNIVTAFHQRVQHDHYDDPTAASFAALWMTKRDEILRIVERAEHLAQVLQDRAVQRVVCHADLHGNNVLVGADDELTIVDWDAPILAPKERDLMFIGGGVGGVWNNDQEAEWFYQGYGQTEIDRVALAYYRYERIVEDIAEFSEQIFGIQGSVQDRQRGLRLIEQFAPNNVVEIAHGSYQQLSDSVFGSSFLAEGSA